MDDRDNDDKRRIMTPPEEWAGAQGADGNNDWLTESDPPANSDTGQGEAGRVKPPVDESGWLTSENAPREPNFARPNGDSEPEADWFSDSDLDPDTLASASGAADTIGAAAEKLAQARSNAPRPQPDPTPLPELAADESLSEADVLQSETTFSSEDLLTDHKIVGTGAPGKLPLWPTIAGALAVLLLIMAGWGAFSERSALQTRIAQLEQETSAPQLPAGSLSAEEASALQAERASLRMQLDALRSQYSGVQAELESLRSQEDASATPTIPAVPASAVSVAESSKPEATMNEVAKEPSQPMDSAPAAATTPRGPAPSKPAVSGGNWFVNVAAYSKSSTAEMMAEELRNEGFQVFTATVESGGRTLHRVRAVGFTSQSEAKTVASELERQYNTGPLWVGQDSSVESVSARAREQVDEPSGTPETGSDRSSAAAPVSLPSVADTGWFIYVDTYSKGMDADDKAQEIEDAGFAAKVAVEYRSGELFYRVQIVGIASREEGEAIIETLSSGGDMPNLQLRQY